MGANGDGVEAHLDDGIIVAAFLGHVAEVEDVGLCDLKLFEEVGHTELLVHAWGGDVDRGGAADFVEEVGEEFATTGDDGFALPMVRIPSVFGFGAGLLTEGGEGDLGEAIFDDFVARGELVGFPVAEFASGLLQGLSDALNIFGLQGVIIDLLPIVLVSVEAIVLSALSDKEMKVGELLLGDAGGFQRIDDLDEELLEFLAGDGADFEVVEAANQQLGDFSWYGGFGDIEGLINVKS